MIRKVYEINPAQAITAGAVGEPGHRVFYIQARTPKETVTLVAEKEQVQVLAHGIHQLLKEISDNYPVQSEGSPVRPLELQPPLEPNFRVGQIELGYDTATNLIMLVAHELVEEDQETKSEVASETASLARIWATCSQMRAMADHALEVAARGRPRCPLCGLPDSPQVHVCPKRNGHLSTPSAF